MKWKWGREITQWWRLEFKVRFRQQISSTFNFRRGSFFILIAKSISPKFLLIWTKQRIICTDKNIKLKRHATTTIKKKKEKEKVKSEIAQISGYSTRKTFSQEKALHSGLLSLNFIESSLRSYSSSPLLF